MTLNLLHMLRIDQQLSAYSQPHPYRYYGLTTINLRKATGT